MRVRFLMLKGNVGIQMDGQRIFWGKELSRHLYRGIGEEGLLCQ